MTTNFERINNGFCPDCDEKLDDNGYCTDCHLIPSLDPDFQQWLQAQELDDTPNDIAYIGGASFRTRLRRSMPAIQEFAEKYQLPLDIADEMFLERAS
jgi:hypothetical protein